VADLNGNGHPDLVVFHIDNPAGPNHGYYRVGMTLVAADAFNVRDWYLPANAQNLNATDLDLGGSSALLLPSIDGGHDQMLVTSGKDGNVYLLDRTNMGHWGGEAWRAPVFNGEARCAPAYYRSPGGDRYAFLSGRNVPGLVAFRVVVGAGGLSLSEAWRAVDKAGKPVGFGNAAGSPLVVSTGGSDPSHEDAVVLVVDGGDGVTPVLRAFNVADGKEIYNSSLSAGDTLGPVPHYPPLNCSNQSIFVGTNKGLACYHLP
jgi:hypothetical protein